MEPSLMHDRQLTELFRTLETGIELAGPDPEFADALYQRLRTATHRRGIAPRRAFIGLAAVLLLTAVLIGGMVAVGSGLIRLPWETRIPLDPAAVDPCSIVPGWAPTEVSEGDTWDPTGRISAEDRASRAIGPGCGLLVSYPSVGGDELTRRLHWRAERTTPEDAAALADRFFADRRPPFTDGPFAEETDEYRLWFGRVPTSARAEVAPFFVEESYFAVAVLDEPYFFVIDVPVMSTAVPSYEAGVIWWERWIRPAVLAEVEEILARIRELESRARP
jgi:hypothetical protein